MIIQAVPLQTDLKYDVIIIGAGAAGLTAMKYLLAAGQHVCMLEAAAKPGGRILTITKEGFDEPVEAGAEFIHGKLPYTFKLLKEANISYEAVEGRMVAVEHGKWQEEEEDDHWDEFIRKLKKLKTDISVKQFLEENFSEEKYFFLRRAVINFAEGFDLADISRASMLSIKDEWKDIERTQYRVKGGYIQLINFLVNSCDHNKASFHFNTCINRIEYKKDSATAYTIDNRKFEASFVIVTASAGLLQSGSIAFNPLLTAHNKAINDLGFGTVIKFLFWFKTKWWTKHGDDLGFILSDEEIPTWWTQLPNKNNLLTGWLGGPRAAKKSNETEGSLFQSALISLSSIFHVNIEELRNDLIHYKIIPWQNYPYVNGGYSYNTLNSEKARKILAEPAEGTIFFAGEAYSECELSGTVEAALQSGHDVAEKLINQYVHKKTTSSVNS